MASRYPTAAGSVVALIVLSQGVILTLTEEGARA
jgi:hypothetical protein